MAQFGGIVIPVMQPTTPQLLTRWQAARILSVSVRTLDGLTRTGALPYVKVGKCVRFRPSALDSFVEERESRSTPPVPVADGKEAGR